MNHEYELRKSKTIDPFYRFTARTFLWMFIGLGITAATSFFMVSSGLVYAVVANPVVPFILVFAKLALVVYLSARIYKLSAAKGKMLFMVYSVTMGITLSSIAFLYEGTTIYWAFAFTAILFGCLSAVGYTTKKDLSSFGPLLVVGLVLLMVFSLVGIFINLAPINFAISLIGVVLFLGLTIYDTQKMKQTYYHFENDAIMLEKLSTLFALELYLDFINLFLYLLRIMGRND